MASREKNDIAPHHPLLSSLVVRPADSGGGGGGSDYELGEVRPDRSPRFRSDRYENGYRMRAGSVSPVLRSDEHHRFSPDFERSNGAPKGRGFFRGRGPPRHRNYSPPYGGRGRFANKGYDRSGHDPVPFRGHDLFQNNPNVQPREGDWVCSDPFCTNLNFARRDHCNKCHRPRYAPPVSPRRRYPGSSFPPRQRYPSPPPLHHSPPGRIMNGGGYRSPPRSWSRDDHRDMTAARPPLRRNNRFPDSPLRDDRRDYPEADSRDRSDRPEPVEFDRGRDNNNFSSRRGGYGRRELSPPPAPELRHPPRGWAPPIRERSRSPVRRDVYMNRGRGGRRGGFSRETF